jgi:hypothetical protein
LTESGIVKIQEPYQTLLKDGRVSSSIGQMNQWSFDADLKVAYDDTGVLMPFPEQEEGFCDNPIRRLFEQVEEEDVQEEE